MTGLQATGLIKRFGGVNAVNGFTISVEPGEIAGLIGPNGAGKTTSFNLLTGLIIPDAGTVVLEGQDITSLRPWHRSRLGLARTFQHTAIFPDLPIDDNLEVAYAAARRPRDTWAERTEELSALLNIEGVDRGIAVRNFAYGVQRRVSIALALAGKPKYLLLDEPAAGLNPTESKQLSTAVKRIAETGVGVILVEHDLELVGRTSDRVVVLAAGATIFSGSYGDAIRDKTVVDTYLGKRYRDA